jgi:membrane protease YdiL (CAAX protease family)
MLEYDVRSQPERHPALTLLLIVSVVFLGFYIVGPLIGFVLSLPFYPGDIESYQTAITHITEHPEIKIPLFIMQGCATFIGLIVGPSLLLNAEGKRLGIFFQDRGFKILPIVLTTLVVIVFTAVNSVFIEWNASVTFPEIFKSIEVWARDKEDEAKIITEFLTKFDSPVQFSIAMFVVAVLPAIGEEIVFRGLLQNEFYRNTKNIHLSIWISAVLFSAIHIQFFGFVPRMLLGAMFGYLYHWSGSLSMAILAHFINNAFSVIAIYLYQLGYFDVDVEKAVVPWPAVMFSGILTVILLYSFRKYYKQYPAA